MSEHEHLVTTSQVDFPALLQTLGRQDADLIDQYPQLNFVTENGITYLPLDQIDNKYNEYVDEWRRANIWEPMNANKHLFAGIDLLKLVR